MDERKRELLAGYVDGELSQSERAEFEERLAINAELRAELEEFKRLKEVTSMARYADLPNEVWESYWESIYKKVERGLGWIFLSVGTILLLGYGLFEILSKLFADPTVPLLIKIGVGAAAAGMIFLLVSFGRERLFAYKRDRYREVDK